LAPQELVPQASATANMFKTGTESKTKKEIVEPHGLMGHHVGYPTVAVAVSFFSGFRVGRNPAPP